MARWTRQVGILLYKNWLLSFRAKKSTIIQIVAPFLFMLLLFAIQQAVKNSSNVGDKAKVVRNPTPQAPFNIPICKQQNGQPCWSFAFVPDTDPDVVTIINSIRTANSPQIPALDEEDGGVLGFATTNDLDQYIFDNPNRTQGAFIFERDTSVVPNTFTFILQLNESSQYVHGQPLNKYTVIYAPMLQAGSQAIMRFISGDPDLIYDFDFRQFPHPEAVTDTIIGDAGPFFIFGALMFTFVVSTGVITLEKEARLREQMKLAGLSDSAYWVSWFIYELVFYLICIFGIIIGGCIFQFDFFLNNTFLSYFLLLFCFSLTLIPLTTLIVSFVKRSAQATSVGFIVFLAGVVLQMVGAIVFGNSSTGIQVIFSFFSPAILAKGLGDLAVATQRSADTGVRVSDLSTYPHESWTLLDQYIWLLADAVLYWLIALYLDNVVPNITGNKRKPNYFLTKSYWMGSSAQDKRSAFANRGSVPVTRPKQSNDVYDEEVRVHNGDYDRENSLAIHQIRREFDATGTCSCCCCCCDSKRNKVHVAVNDVSVVMERDQLFCLLGHNGAGKTTLISMLTGLIEVTRGDADMFGVSVVDQISEAQSLMGVCPQFEVQWPELTAQEHMWIFGVLRGISWAESKRLAVDLLEEVDLTFAAKRAAGGFSGGMKRRLAVAIAFLGNPPVVFLDEPTTGMDPISRRKVWEFIQKSKKGRVIVLTTHSMEEADVLSEKIAVMAGGRLRAIGNSLRLKNLYGGGYKIVVQISELGQNLENLKNFFARSLPASRFESELSGFVTFKLPLTDSDRESAFFEDLENSAAQFHIEDIQIAMPTLEEVFIRLSDLVENPESSDEDFEGGSTNPLGGTGMQMTPVH